MNGSNGMWNIFDGQKSVQVTTKAMDQDWEVNIKYDMFPGDIPGDLIDVVGMRRMEQFKELEKFLGKKNGMQG